MYPLTIIDILSNLFANWSNEMYFLNPLGGLICFLSFTLSRHGHTLFVSIRIDGVNLIWRGTATKWSPKLEKLLWPRSFSFLFPKILWYKGNMSTLLNIICTGCIVSRKYFRLIELDLVYIADDAVYCWQYILIFMWHKHLLFVFSFWL